MQHSVRVMSDMTLDQPLKKKCLSYKLGLIFSAN